ncbi:MAG: TonB family protein [Candidatus Obscuribacterales bacterium]|nr:TonB family protein [Steroidobacteraceae bacterium]
MSSRREPSYPQDDAPPRIVGHRLQQTAGQAVSNASLPAKSSAVSAQIKAAANAPVGTPGAPTPGRSAGENTGQMPVRSAAARRQVVLVDREIDAFRDIAIALRDEYDFHITISGNEALALLKNGVIDTLVVGQTLYSSTGINVLSAARRHAPQTHRVLLANAVEASGVDRDGSDAAPFRILPRPCTSDKLRDLLESAADISKPAAPAHKEPLAPPKAPVIPPTINFPSRPKLDPPEFEHVVMETTDRPRRRTTAAQASVGPLPIVVFTDNAEFYQALCAALQDHHDVRLATQIERVVELAEIGACPVLITDRAGTQTELQRISIAVRAVEAASVTIAAGTLQEGHALRKLMGTGALHSFLPKPLSAPLVRLAVESAKRQYVQQKHPPQPEPEDLSANPPTTQSTFARGTAPTPAVSAPYVPMDFGAATSDSLGMRLGIDGYEASRLLRALPRIGLIAAAGLSLAAAGFYGWQYYQSRNLHAATIEEDIRLAQRAFNAGRIATPSDASALYYYGEALQLDPKHVAAQTGYEQTVERLIEQIEQALVEERLEAAADNLAVLSDVRPNHRRFTYLSAQLAKARSYQAAARSRTGDKPTNDRGPTSVTRPATVSPPALTANSSESQRQQTVSRWISTAQQRMAQGRLVTPENDSAESYLRQAERTDPTNTAVQRMLSEIGERLMAEAREALSRQQLETARRRLNDAVRFDPNPNTVDRLQREIDAAATTGTRSQYLRLALQRTREDQLLEPERDSAKYYLSQLQRLDPSSAETEQALRALGMRLIDRANQASKQQQFNTAVRLLSEARQIGFAGTELTDAETGLRTARNPPPASAIQPLAAAPKLLKAASPVFPDDAAKAGVEGWVDVGFRITPNGGVTEVAAVASNAPGRFAAQFERAAVAAIGRYQFEPRAISDDRAQRMVVRVQFNLK